MNKPDNIIKLRKEIDSLDRQILSSLNKRARISSRIGKLKIDKGVCVYVEERERQVLKKLSQLNRGPLSQDALSSIYREVISSMRALEKPLTIAYFGPEASFTHLAAMKKFGSQVTYLAIGSISDCFTAVEHDRADFGVIPVENSIEGAVSHTMDMLTETDLNICSQVLLEISHNLLSKYPMGQIKRIYSINQVFGQCRIWLSSHMPKAELVEVSSTSRGAQIAKKEKNSACIASLLASKIYDLQVVKHSIEDSPHNITRFLVVGKVNVPQTDDDKTSIVFSIQDKVGALYEMLTPFKKYSLNLTKIESRPSKKKAWDYYFFIDFLGHRDEPNVKKAVEELDKKCKFLKILGSYPNF